jgi:hypothetical protein
MEWSFAPAIRPARQSSSIVSSNTGDKNSGTPCASKMKVLNQTNRGFRSPREGLRNPVILSEVAAQLCFGPFSGPCGYEVEESLFVIDVMKSAESVVIFRAEVSNQLFAHHPPQRIFQLHELDEKVVLGIELRRAHGRFEVKAEPFLNAAHAGALR